MAKNASLHIRVDENLKSEADKVFKSVGLNTSAAVNIFLQQAVDKGCLPFSLEAIQKKYKDI